MPAVDAPPRPVLKPLALQALTLVARDGLTELEAARVLNYGPTYIRQVLAESYRQLGARNARQAIFLATRWGLIR